MPEVPVVINNRKYRMACEDGEEKRLLQLCADFDRRISELRAEHGEIGDARLLLMAAIKSADELTDANERLRRVEQELATLRNARAAAADRTQASHVAIVDAFNTAAERIEELSRRLNQSLGNGVAIG
jgi:cell division protein ZapA